MASNSVSKSKAQLDKKEREHLESVVGDMRERVEDNVEFQLKQKNIENKPDDLEQVDEETERLVEAIELEAVDGHSWNEAFDQYVTGVGYTIVNRLAALRCMEVRDFIDEEVTIFKDNGLTPAADTLVHEEFLLEDEAILEAYHNACDELAEEIEILFDRSSAYSLIDPDNDTYEDVCEKLAEVPENVWRADDVLGWVYEYYNTPRLEEVQRKAREGRLEIEDVPAANQFYTPHWVVRSLTDNSLGKLYLESTNQLDDTIEKQTSLTPSERINRDVSSENGTGIADLCTYLVQEGEDTSSADFTHPSEIRVIDPACGSGHFLLYAFDVLERIWWNECPDIPREEVPKKILQNNLYGVDIDLRACQIAALSLYLKGRERSEREGEQGFELPEVGIVCADARVADSGNAVDVFSQVADDNQELQDTLEDLLTQFEDVQGLGSLLKVRDTISDEFLDRQAKLTESWGSARSLNAFLDELHDAISEQRDGESFLAQDLKSFLRLLQVLSQDYDVALMNPPYGAKKRMPEEVSDYVEDHYEYGPEYYINFFEVCESVLKKGGRVGMIVPRTFMFKSSFQDFREDFIGSEGSFDFLAEYGNDVLDNATVRTAGTVVRVDEQTSNESSGTFFRLHDVDTYDKEKTFVEAAFGEQVGDIPRKYVRPISEFDLIPGSPLSYWASTDLRALYDSETVFDAENGNLEEQNGLGSAKQGLSTADNARFVRKFWEGTGDHWVPFAKGGKDAWILPNLNLVLGWGDNGEELRRFEGSYIRNEDAYFKEALTWTYMKAGGRRFGYLHPDSVFGRAGCVFVPDRDVWDILSYANSSLTTYLMICQTPDRQWEVGYVSRLPWREDIIDQSDLDVQAKEIAGTLLALRGDNITSPHYTGPALLKQVKSTQPDALFDHPHRTVLDELPIPENNQRLSPDSSISELSAATDERKERLQKKLQEKADYIDEYVFDLFDVSDEGREDVYREIALRTNEDPRQTDEYNPDSVTETRENTVKYVKDLLVHLTLEAIQDDPEGIIELPTEIQSSRETLLEAIVSEFKSIFGNEHKNRLAETDELLGNKDRVEEAYPNLRDWLQQDLFEYLTQRFENRPVLWKLTTKNLVPDPEGEGFSCLLDYHQFDTGTFDRLESQYIEPRKAELRERRNSAERRRSDDSLSARERAEATETFERCKSGLQQIERFQESVQNLIKERPRDWGEKDRELAEDLHEDIEQFCAITEEKIQCYEQLLEMKDKDELEETFSASFVETLKENKEEWISAIEDLEHAAESYTKSADKPVEAHQYDLLTYFGDELKGSVWPTSTGILSIGYYPKKKADGLLNENGQPKESLVDEEAKLLAQIASEFEQYESLAEEIESKCDDLSSRIPSEWEERALSEITTAGYQPNHKHGVVINITPLDEAEVVPEVVDNQIL